MRTPPPRHSSIHRSAAYITIPRPRRKAALSLAITVLLSLGFIVAANPVSALVHRTGSIVIENDSLPVELGVRVTANTDGRVSGVRFYKGAGNTGTHVGNVWDTNGRRLATATFTGESATGWQTVKLSTPIPLTKGQSVVVSYFAPRGHYAQQQYAFTRSQTLSGSGLMADRGVYSYSATSAHPSQSWHDSSYYVEPVWTRGGRRHGRATAPTRRTTTTTPAPTTTTSTPVPTTTTSAPSPSTTTTKTTPTTTTSTSTTGFPTEASTGWTRTGVTLSAYTGTCTITTANTVIDAKTISCDVIIKASGVKITRSQINGRIGSTSGGSVAITDSNIDGGNQEMFPAVGQENIALLRVNVVGGQHSVQCYANCSVTDSYLHGQTQPASGGHVNAFISNGGSNFTLTHNTLACTVTPTGTGGGCTADASLFGDFGPIQNATFENNLFKANSSGAGYCTQAGYNPGKNYPNSTFVVYRNNVFERGSNNNCGIWGPVTAFNSSAAGNVWTGNAWDGGGAITP